jgi:hypothetical protein
VRPVPGDHRLVAKSRRARGSGWETRPSDLRGHNPNLPSALAQLLEPKGPRPAIPPNRGRPLVTAYAVLDHCGTDPARTEAQATSSVRETIRVIGRPGRTLETLADLHDRLTVARRCYPWLSGGARPQRGPAGIGGDAAAACCTCRSEPVLYRRIVFAAATLRLPVGGCLANRRPLTAGTAWAA